jgi:hypothetical protein
MTPSLGSVYDALIARAADAEMASAVAAIREAFVRRVGPFAPADAWFEERSAALWDRVLTDATANARMAQAPASDEQRAALEALSRAQRGLFEVHAAGDDVDLVCVVTGAAFRLARSDEGGRALAIGHRGIDDVAPGFVDARVVPTVEGVSLLPGVLAHAAEARPQIEEVVARGRERAMEHDDLFDALLSMRHRLASLSRMKAKQVYRVELLDALSSAKASTPSP